MKQEQHSITNNVNQLAIHQGNNINTNDQLDQ